MVTRTIRTHYEGPTDTRGSRIVARSEGRQTTVAYDYHHAMGYAQHERAARALMARRGWTGTLEAGDWRDDVCVWTVTESAWRPTSDI